MYDVKPEIKIALETIPGITVSDAYPTDWRRLPAVSFYEGANSDALQIQDNPISDISIQIDIWARGSTGSLAQQVNEKMQALGFRRQFASDVPDPSDIKHKTMRYRARIDARTGRAHQ